MKLIACIEIDKVGMAMDALLVGYEAFTLVWSRDTLKIYKQIA